MPGPASSGQKKKERDAEKYPRCFSPKLLPMFGLISSSTLLQDTRFTGIHLTSSQVTSGTEKKCYLQTIHVN